ncbi:MAG: ERCC4 domain-containing protein [Nitrososphaerota archaeon]
MILIDYREKESGIPRLLIKKNIPISFENLKIGDYIIGDIVIERKTSKDFIASIFDGRIFDQANKISSYTNKSILLIEGGIHNELEYIKNKNSIYGALLSLILSYNFKIIHSNDIEETSNILEIIHKHGKYEKINKIFIKPKKKADDISEQQINIIASIPFIGEKYAERLLRNLKTIKNIVNATPQTLSLVANIHPKNAYKIWRILNKEYEK